MRLCTHWWLGLKRRTWPPMAVTPVSLAIRTSASASSTLSVTGISTSTCLPGRGVPARGGGFGLAGDFALTGRLAPVLENDVSDCGVRRRHGVEAIDLVDLVVERTAHDQPHHHLDAFGSGLAHELEVRDAR